MASPFVQWPTFLGIGVPKAGSSWLYEVLDSHPHIWVPEEREVHFFDRYYQERGLTWYRKLFPNVEKSKYKAIGEVTPQYIYCESEQIDALKSSVPSIEKFIIILRNPVDALYSGYWFSKRVDNFDLTFREFLEQRSYAVEHAHYAHHLKRWLEYFDRDQFLVLTTEEDLSAVEQAREKIAKFLNVDPNLFPEEAGKLKENSRHLPRFHAAYAWAVDLNSKLKQSNIYWPARVAEALGVKHWFGKQEVDEEMDPGLREELEDRYAEDVRKLEQMLGREFPEWDLSSPAAS